MGERMNFMLQRVNSSHNEKMVALRVPCLAKSIAMIGEKLPIEGKTVVEIGTGWDPISSVLMYLAGAKRCYTYDHVRHLRYELLVSLLRVIELQIADLSEVLSIPEPVLTRRLSLLLAASNMEDILSAANIEYRAPAEATATGLQSGSVDLVYSHAVLEHIPKQVVCDLMAESKRILNKFGIAYHLIGLHDHYSSFDKSISKVNFLKYPESLWSFFIKNNISYHNRLREKQFLDIFNKYDAMVVYLDSKTDPNDINELKRMKVDVLFKGMSNEELAVNQMEVVLKF